MLNQLSLIYLSAINNVVEGAVRLAPEARGEAHVCALQPMRGAQRSARLVCASHEAQGAPEVHLGAHSIRIRFHFLLLPIFSLIVVDVAPLVLLLVELLFLLPQDANFY